MKTAVGDGNRQRLAHNVETHVVNDGLYHGYT